MLRTLISFSIALCLLILTVACDAPSVENIYRKESRFPGGLNVPVALLVVEWGGKPRIMGSTWLIDGGHGRLFTAKHVTDTFINSTIELGANECKIFLAGKVYTCIVVQVPPLRDAVVLKMIGPFNQSELPKPYKISDTKLRVGDKIFIQGFHSHPSEITKSNMTDGFKDIIVPIFKTFYELRTADPIRQREVVFDSLLAVVIDTNAHIKIGDEEPNSIDVLKYEVNEYVRVVTIRNHKFSFGGLSGGVAVRINDQGVAEAVGIITAERPERLEYNKKNQLEGKPVHEVVSDEILITPVHSVKDLYDYARQMR